MSFQHTNNLRGFSCVPQLHDVPESEVEAKKHIQTLRKERDLEYWSKNARDLGAVIDLLSKDLYQQPFRFIAEFLQNADDAKYSTLDNPTMNITLQNGTIRFDTNEDGFTRTDVEALCRVCSSSKLQPGQSTNQTGEKGIGFKSAFNVADVIWIKSGPYSFKFDANKPLGKVVPIWAEFPQETLSRQTSILLQLRSDSDELELVHEVCNLEAPLLLFLRRIEEIKISVHHTKKSFSTILKRQQTPMTASLLARVVLKGSHSCDYWVSQYHVPKLPYDPRRDGSQGSTISIAFPVKVAPQVSDLETQHVYAFFPIRDYGFKFILQSDFILTASREDIENGSEWNKALRDQIPLALLKAINQFNQHDAYTSWLPYVAFDHQRHGFFQDLGQSTLRLLAKEPILKSFQGHWESPSKLTRIPKELADQEGHSMIIPRYSQYTLISQDYEPQDARTLASLGVETLSDDGFLGDLSNFISQYPTLFQAHPLKWHSRLAQILLALYQTHKAQILALPIVHLKDGRWITPHAGQLLLPLKSSLLTVPKGIPAFEVHPDFVRDDRLFQLLGCFGIRESGSRIVCDIIAEMHTRMKKPPKEINSKDLVSQVLFLFRARWKPLSDINRIWLVAEDDSRHPSSQVYIDTDLAYSASEVFQHHRSRFHFLHKSYRNAMERDRGWIEWMEEALEVARVPRLLSTTWGDERRYSIADDLWFLLRHYKPKIILEILRHHWPTYSPLIQGASEQATRVEKETTDTINAQKDLQRHLRASIECMEAFCHGGYMMKLSRTYVPRKNVLLGLGYQLSVANDPAIISSVKLGMKSTNEHHFLDLENPEDESWDFLHNFGVIVLLKPAQFIARLMSLQGSNITKDLASTLYEQIMACKDESDLGSIRRAFSEAELILIPSEKDLSDNQVLRWVTADECVWEGPSCLQKIPCLGMYYPSHEGFFRNLLNIQDANLKTLVSEIGKITLTDSLGYIRKLLETTGHYTHAASYSDLKDNRIFSRLREHKMWPVSSGEPRHEFDRLMDSKEAWYIPDHEHLRSCFRGKLPFLSFDPTTLAILRPLFELLGVEKRLISAASRSKSTTDGGIRPIQYYTQILTQKSKLIARLVPITNPDRERILGHLHDIRVYQCERILNKWTVVTQTGDIVEGRVEPGRVCLTQRPGGLDIYLCHEDCSILSPPLELTEDLASFCGIKNLEHRQLLTHILVQQDVRRITRDLDRRGVSNDVTGFDDQLEPPDEGSTQAYQGGSAGFFSAKRDMSPPHMLDKDGSHISKTEKYPFESQLGEPQVSERIESHKTDDLDVKNLGVVNESGTENHANDPGDLPVQLNNALINAISTTDTTFPGSSWRSTRGLAWPKDQKRYKLMTLGPMGSSIEYGVMATSIPFSYSLSGTHESEDNFLGQLYVSEALGEILRGDYNPSEHWTSDLRRKASHKPFEGDDPSISTFTIRDKNDRLRGFLLQHGFDVQQLATSSTFHIETVVSDESFDSGFRLHSSQAKKFNQAQSLSLAKKSDHRHAELFILAFVAKLNSKPTIAFFADPWSLYNRNMLSLEALSGYWAHFSEKTPSINVCSALQMIPRSSSTTRTYEYRTLQFREIRLLKLSHGSCDMPLYGTIYHAPVDSTESYRALSYVWGTVNLDLAPYYINTPDGRITISLSLYLGLRAIRDASDEIILWIDAICINQMSNTEKAIQIRLLSSIFQSASQVVAWLGPEGDNSSVVINKLNSVAQHKKSSYWPKVLRGNELDLFEIHLKGFNEDLWASLDAFLDRPWFKRAWIVQELVLSRNVLLVCGQSQIGWDDFFDALKLCERGLNLGSDNRLEETRLLPHAGWAYALGITRNSLIYQKRKFGLLNLFEVFSHCQAKHRIDKLFSLLGIACDSTEKALDPDYDSPESTVILRYAKCFVQRGQVMDLLSRAGASGSYKSCSWIPNWTGQCFPPSITTWETQKGDFYAGGKNYPDATVQQPRLSDPCVLQIRGYTVDTIVFTADIHTSVNIRTEFHSVAQRYRQLLEFVQDYPSGESKLDILLRLPIGDAKRPHLESTVDKLRAYREFADEKPQEWPIDLRELVWGTKRRGSEGEAVALRCRFLHDE
ncbi:putative Heterokaryon incompatibility protein [Fusarium austroafricanum]|uniref:Putative Heterokaryon incompatibility protein n=1 Tax=Fusarium austroafricanum TaxID=2364996 RepID=A0A8H4KAI3_9HYPO|nr:putative Heterokaryon incompatibility protein [Fusarium austroafricanum]